jgi:hypothetical protein
MVSEDVQTGRRVLIDIIDYNYPSVRRKFEPQIMDLNEPNNLMYLVLVFGNGILVEMRVEAESQYLIEVLQGLAIGTGRCELIELTSEEKDKLWLYEEGDLCYRQPMREPAFAFIDPVPHPEKFMSP